MTTKTKPGEVNIVGGKCADCGASVSVENADQDHDKTPQHQAWLEKVTAPENPERAKPGDLEKLPQELQDALGIMNDIKAVRDQTKRMQLTAKQVRVVYKDNHYDLPQERPRGVPPTVRECLELYHIPILQSPTEIRRHLDAQNPFRRV